MHPPPHLDLPRWTIYVMHITLAQRVQINKLKSERAPLVCFFEPPRVLSPSRAQSFKTPTADSTPCVSDGESLALKICTHGPASKEICSGIVTFMLNES